MEHGDKDSATLHEEIAEVLGGWRNSAATAYTEAAEERAKGNNEAAEAWHKCARATEARAAALARGDIAAAKYYCQQACSFVPGPRSFSESPILLRSPSPALFLSTQQITTSAKDDKTMSPLPRQRANSWTDEIRISAAALVPSQAATEATKGNKEAAEAHRKDAQAHEARADALIQELKTTEDKSESTLSSSQQEKQKGSTLGKKGNGNCSVS